MDNIRMIINRSYITGRIDPRIYGSFLEHMGRVVYGGIYEPGHPMADEEGFRKDVLDAVRELGVTQVRYPGGNFVSCYHWEDGVGPVNARPRRLELAWKAIETNAFGTGEYMNWIKKARAEPMLAVNLGSRGMEDAINYLEYCNFPGGTKYSDLRISHGQVEPYRVKLWCLGNEMDGSWQIGHKTAAEYGRLAAETAKIMKRTDDEIELVVCGSSLKTMETFPEWEKTVLEHTYEYIDYISLHQYFGNQENGTEKFLAQADEMDEYIKSVIAVCDFVKAKKRSGKEIKISFDEWGVWAYHPDQVTGQCEDSMWQETQIISEMIYTFEDSLLFGGMLLALLKNAGRVKIACQSLLTNISAMIMTEKNGGIWYQPTYYPFYHAANYGKGLVMDIRPDGADTGNIDCVVVYNDEDNEIVVFAINRNLTGERQLDLEVQGLRCISVIEHCVMESDDFKAVNQYDHDKVKPYQSENTKVIEHHIRIELPRLSWNMIRVRSG